MVETRSVSFSIVLHATVLLIAAFGLPALLPKKPDPMPLVMTVELLPISEISNVKPSDQPIQKAQNAPAPKPAPTPPTPKVQPAPTPPAPTPPPPKSTFDPDVGAEPKDKIKPQEKPPEKPKEPPKPTVDQKANEDFKNILDKLSKEAEKTKATPAATPGTDKATVPENKTKSDAPYNDALPMSISEKDQIRSQFIPCWNKGALAGSKDAQTLAARVKVKLQPDGTVLEATLAPDQSSRYNSDTFFRAAADSAIRAVYKCSPLKNLPADKYNSWKEMELNFDPSEL